RAHRYEQRFGQGIRCRGSRGSARASGSRPNNRKRGMMKGKLLLAAGIGVGFVLGSRAGRQSYETLKGYVQDLWSDPKVQDRVSDIEDTVKEKVPVVQDKAE